MIFTIISNLTFGKVDLRASKFTSEDLPTFVVGSLAGLGLITGLAFAGLWPASLMFAGVFCGAGILATVIPQKE